jgi:hypothetical protein
MSKEKQWAEMTADDKIEKLLADNAAQSEGLAEFKEKTGSLVEAIQSKMEELETEIKELKSANQKEEVSEEIAPVEFRTFEFEYKKQKYVFTRPTGSLLVKGKYEPFTAAEVADNENLQKEFVDLFEKEASTFIKPIK